MALRPDRNEVVTDISFFMNEAAERGLVVTASTQGSGAAMDDSSAAVKVAVSGEKPVGLLLNDVVDLDLTRQHINYAKDEVQQGGKGAGLRGGTVVTDQISGTITLGDPAHFGEDGKLVGSVTTSAQVGRFLSKKDADGFAKVAINIV